MRKGILILAFCLAGCATPIEHNTPSLRPEATFSKDLSTTHSLIINAMINRQYQIVKDSPNLVIGEKRSDNVAANMLLGSQFNPVVNARLSITLASTSPTQTRAVADMALVTNPGTGFEQLTPMNNSQDSENIQEWLTSLR